jgi:hypothetical protein
VSNHTRFGRHFEKFWYIQNADTLNIEGTASSVCSVIAMWVNCTHNVTLCKYKIVNDGVDLIFAAPRYEVSKHQLDIVQFKLPRATKSEHVHIVEFTNLVHFIFRDPILKRGADLILFR